MSFIMDEDQDILSSLGASAVECGTFEESFMKKLEEHFDVLENDEELEDGELESSPKEETTEDAMATEGESCREDVGKEMDVTIVKPEVEIPESGFSFLRKALESQATRGIVPTSTVVSKQDSTLSSPQVLQPSRTKNVVKKTPSQLLVLQKPAVEESAEELKIRTGEMTPFGTVIARTEGGPKASFLDFSKYLNSQKAFEKNWKKKPSKSGPGKGQNSLKESIKEVPARKRTTSLGKDPLKYDVMFPKKRKLKEDLGTKSSTSSEARRQTTGTLPSESRSVYMNEDEDSDYKPPDESDDEWSPDEKRVKLTRQPNTPKKKQGYKEADTDDSFSEEEEDKRPNKRNRREADDGDYKFYQQRVQNWKENETRFTGGVQTLSDGFKLPKHIWESLYDYQKVGVNWLWELHQKNCGGILGDEMGLGKTIQMIAFLAGLSCSNLQFRFTRFRGLGPSIVVCPATVMHQWVKEFHTWWPPFRVVVLHESGSYSGSKQGLIRSVAENNGILITSYVGIVNSQTEILKHSWHYVILDEGHKIRNPDAQVTLSVKQIPTAHRIILSGSPLQNNLKELWSLFDFVFPGKLGTLPAFMEQFAVPITQGGYANASEVQVAAAYKCATILRDIINPYLLRRMKSDVKDHVNLPPKSEQVLFCKMTNEQKACYINYLQSKEIDSIVQGRFNMFAGLINLRKICNHHHLFDGGPKLIKNPTALKKKGVALKSQQKRGTSSSLDLLSSYHSLKGEVSDPEEPAESDDSDIELDPHDSFGHWSKSGKMVVLETLLKLWRKQDHKVLLFSQSRQMLCILENFVRLQNYSYLRLDGSTTIGSRQPLIKKFNEDPSIFIFILTTKVGGLGVNLTGANRVIIFDPDWNPSTDLQARERAWRIGQDRQVTIYRLITSGTIEEKIYHRQIFKQFLTNRVLKDPKQKRFFKASDVLELFSFNEGFEKGNESEAIFAGTGSAVDMKALKRRRVNLAQNIKQTDTEEATDTTSTDSPRERATGKFKGIPNLVKQRTQKHDKNNKEDDAPENNHEIQDDYVLRKLFRKSGVQAALKHDKIVDTGESDYLLVEKEAERVAAQAVAVLKRSREQCWAAESGLVTWTGNNGVINETPPPPKKKLRLGPKKLETVSSKPAEKEPPSYFSGTVEASGDSETLSSADLVAAIRARKRIMDPIGSEENQIAADEDGNPLTTPINSHLIDSEHVDMLREIREFIAFRAQVDGQASTSELINEFGNKLPSKESPLFKHMLSELCSFRRVEGHGIWRLKPEFSLILASRLFPSVSSPVTVFRYCLRLYQQNQVLKEIQELEVQQKKKAALSSLTTELRKKIDPSEEVLEEEEEAGKQSAEEDYDEFSTGHNVTKRMTAEGSRNFHLTSEQIERGNSLNKELLERIAKRKAHSHDE
ncbi:unnamed protein product [Allacma fusca]|uniref:DNA repair and recombination protein RAD54-like n=1 Tax=Allacma fusca TaxID=39272 RepID=A0A8J2JWH5_9HEXA|nr:unnamed protein product [Allacma fusca]